MHVPDFSVSFESLPQHRIQIRMRAHIKVTHTGINLLYFGVCLHVSYTFVDANVYANARRRRWCGFVGFENAHTGEHGRTVKTTRKKFTFDGVTMKIAKSQGDHEHSPATKTQYAIDASRLTTLFRNWPICTHIYPLQFNFAGTRFYLGQRSNSFYSPLVVFLCGLLRFGFGGPIYMFSKFSTT